MTSDIIPTWHNTDLLQVPTAGEHCTADRYIPRCLLNANSEMEGDRAQVTEEKVYCIRNGINKLSAKVSVYRMKVGFLSLCLQRRFDCRAEPEFH